MLDDQAMLDLQRHYVCTQREIGVNFYILRSAQAASCQFSRLKEQLVHEMEKVESSVWNKKFPIIHSTFDLDYVLIMAIGASIIGFASAGLFSAGPESNCLYLSEIMILKNFQRLGLSRTALILLNESAVKDSPRISECYFVVLSGHIALFRALYSKFDALTLDTVGSPMRESIEAYIRRDIQDNCILADGVVKEVWANQPTSKRAVWPAELAIAHKLPIDVDHSRGDAVLRVFRRRRPLSIGKDIVVEECGRQDVFLCR